MRPSATSTGSDRAGRTPALAAILPGQVREIRSAGDGAHGPRECAWALLPLPDREAADGFTVLLLIRRHPTTGMRAYYLVHALLDTPLAEIVRGALGDRGMLPGR
ncbi:hypothetical protein ACFZDF_19895 [Streptomyces sp. NPDC007910]|uniref:hypothetical protein n=1 Tax=Streptomyces sp. NPDC007910 TaxID=3364790 RepID=UPI0036E25B7F